jgi:hypothetical protein
MLPKRQSGLGSGAQSPSERCHGDCASGQGTFGAVVSDDDGAMLVAFGDDLEQQLSTSLVRGKVSQLNNQEPTALVSGIQRSSPFIQSTSVFRSPAYRLILRKSCGSGAPCRHSSISPINSGHSRGLFISSSKAFVHKFLVRTGGSHDAFVLGTGKGKRFFL